MSKRWYAVQAFSGYEKIVQKSLLDRVVQSGHEDLFGDISVSYTHLTLPTKRIV